MKLLSHDPVGEPGFDAPRLRGRYPGSEPQYTTRRTFDDQEYTVPFKSVMPSPAANKVKVILPGAEISPDLVFKTGAGNVIDYVNTGKPDEYGRVVLELTVSSGMEKVLAYDSIHFPATETTEAVTKQMYTGELAVRHYYPKTRHVVLVPVNDASLPGGAGEADLLASLNAIYAPGNVNWTVSVDAGLRVNAIDAGMTDSDDRIITRFTSDMNLVIDAFEGRPGDPADDTYYMFLIDKSNLTTKEGYMPFSQPYGFITVGGGVTKDDFIRTTAHELGHGAFNLRHPFSDRARYPLTEGITGNLMDYGANNGTELFAYQWDMVDDPRFMLAWFMSEEEAAFASLMIELENFQEENPFAWMLSTSRNKYGFPLELNESIWDIFANRGSVEQEVRIELHWRVIQVAGAIWDNNGLHNMLDKLQNGQVPSWRAGYKELQNLTSDQRANIKRSDANKMSAILLYEFAYGNGPKQTDFLQTDAFTNDLNKDNVLLKEVIGKFYSEMDSKNYSDEIVFLQSYTNEIFRTNYTFSPDHTGSILESWQKHLNAWNNNPIAFVIGGMLAEIEKKDDKFIIIFNNPMGLRSLGLHLLNDYNPKYRAPLATIYQTFTFELTTDEFKAFK